MSAMESLRILIVDDRQDTANSMSMLLGHTGHQTETAFDGAAALELAERYRPHVILCDIGHARHERSRGLPPDSVPRMGFRHLHDRAHRMGRGKRARIVDGGRLQSPLSQTG